MRKENLFRNKATKSLVAALAVAMATAIVPVSADAAKTTNVTIAKGDSKKLASGLTNAKSSKSSVATVTKTGKVTAKKAGEAKVTATKKGKKVTYKVAVKKAPTISTKSVSVKAGKSKTVTVDKNGAKYLTVSFKSSNTAVAKVNKNGKITGVKKGTAVVTATVKGYNKNYKLKVDVKVTKATATNTEEPTTPGTDEPTTPGTDKPTTPDETTGGSIDTTTGGSIDTTTGGSIDDGNTETPVAPVTPVTPGNGGTSVSSWSDKVASEMVYGNTSELTMKAGSQTVTVTKNALMNYLKDADASKIIAVVDGKEKEIVVGERTKNPTSVADVDQSFTIRLAYDYIVTVKGNYKNAATVTVKAYMPNTAALTLDADTEVVTTDKKELDSKTTNKVTVTYGEDTISIDKEQISVLYKNGALTGETKMKATVNDTEVEFDVTTASTILDDKSALVAATYYLPKSGDLLVLSVSDVKIDSSSKKATVTVNVISAAAKKSDVAITVA